jgi:NAD(P)-dependent dehydrogenase (short-subunit alcohol dehydrogenase family)
MLPRQPNPGTGIDRWRDSPAHGEGATGDVTTSTRPVQSTSATRFRKFSLDRLPGREMPTPARPGARAFAGGLNFDFVGTYCASRLTSIVHRHQLSSPAIQGDYRLGILCSMDLSLRDRVVLVVGGGGFIGSAIVQRARDEGAIAVIASRNPVDGIGLDATDPLSVSAGVDRVIRYHGRLDAVVISAAPAAQTLDPARNSDPAQVAEAFDGKALAFLRVANAAIPIMTAAGYGRIVGISGQNAFLTGNITGAIRNAALNIAAKNLADAVAGSGVTINTVNPARVKSEPSADVEIGRGGESSPAQIADLVAFLISPLSAVSGESIAVGHRVRGVISA